MKLLKLCTIGAAVAGALAMVPTQHQGSAVVTVILMVNMRLLWNLWSDKR
jgi:hypothetical protein